MTHILHDVTRNTGHQYIDIGWQVMLLSQDNAKGKLPPKNCPQCDWKNPNAVRHDPATCTCLLCHGFHAATSDHSRFDQMCDSYPNGSLAIRTGQPSRLLIVDAEAGSKHPDEPSGLEVIEQWESFAGGWSLPPTLTARSVSGGIHLYYAMPPEMTINTARYLPNVDIKADPGYIGAVVEGSQRKWMDPEIPIAPMSGDMLTWLLKRKARQLQQGNSLNAPDGYDYDEFISSGCPDGFRDFFFNDLIYRLRKRGVSRRRLEETVFGEWKKCAQPPDARYEMPWEDVFYKLERVWNTVTPEVQTPTATQNEWVTQQNQTRSREDIRSQPITGRDVYSDPPTGTGTVFNDVRAWDNEHDTDTGNGRRFARLFGGRVVYVPAENKWYLWDGSRWIIDKLNYVMELTLHVIDDIRDFAMAQTDPDVQQRWARHARNTESFNARQRMLSAAATLLPMSVDVEKLDNDPWTIVVKNGTLDLKTGELRDSEPLDFNTKSADVVYDPDAECPEWRSHIYKVCEGDHELMSYLQRACGYTLTGVISEQKFFFLLGSGSNGKNVFIDTIAGLMGEYAKIADPNLITARNDAHTSMIAELRGVRLAMASETDSMHFINDQRIKDLTGSPRLTGRKMYGNNLDFNNSTKLWVLGNNHPRIKDSSHGIWRRIQIVPFNATFTTDTRIANYESILAEERSGILNWMIQGLKQWHEFNNLMEPQAIRDAVDEYREEEDRISAFARLHIEICEDADESTYELANAIYLEYQMWCAMNGEKPLSSVAFGRKLRLIPGIGKTIVKKINSKTMRIIPKIKLMR